MEFEVAGVINKITDQDLLDALSWLATNYGTKIITGSARVAGSERTIKFSLRENNFNDGVTALTVLKQQFGADLAEFNLNMVI